MTFSVGLRDTNPHGFEIWKYVPACCKLVKEFMSKLSITKAPTNKKYSLNFQDVNNFLNFWLLAMLLIITDYLIPT